MNPASSPSLSVVIPSRDRPEVLLQTLRVLCAEKLSDEELPPFEVLVVDDGSAEPLADRLSALDELAEIDLRLHRLPGRGPAAARNLGVAESRAPRILFLGDDTWPEAGVLRRHARPEHEDVGVQGRIEWDPAVGVTPVMEFLAPEGPQFYFRGLRSGEPIPYTQVLGSNLSVPKAWLLEERFDERFAHACLEDTELAYRWNQRGHRVLYDEAALCWHHHRYDTIDSFLDRQWLAGRYAVMAARSHTALIMPLILQPALVGLVHLGRVGWRQLKRSASHPDFWDLQCRAALLRGVLGFRPGKVATS